MPTRKPMVSRQRKPMVRVVTPPITVKVYPLLQDAIESGLKYWVRRVYKHDGTPKTEDELLARVDEGLNAIMVEVSELLDFGDE